MTRTRYTMPARSQGRLYAQRAMPRLVEKDVRRRAFAHSLAPEVESAVRKRLLPRLGGFHCDLQAMHAPHMRSKRKTEDGRRKER